MKINLTFQSLFIVFLLLGCVTGENKNITSESKEEVGSVLPFQEPPTARIAGESLAESKHLRREHLGHLPKDAPNIIIIMNWLEEEVQIIY